MGPVNKTGSVIAVLLIHLGSVDSILSGWLKVEIKKHMVVFDVENVVQNILAFDDVSHLYRGNSALSKQTIQLT